MAKERAKRDQYLMKIRIASRRSDLARLQAYQVGAALKKSKRGLEIEYLFKESLGDQNQDARTRRVHRRLRR